MLIARRLIRALDTLRENKRVKIGVAQLGKRNAKLNDRIKGRSNNSFNRSGMSLPFIVNLKASLKISRPVNSGVRFLLNRSAQILKQQP
jgi:hypothetical protein